MTLGKHLFMDHAVDAIGEVTPLTLALAKEVMGLVPARSNTAVLPGSIMLLTSGRSVSVPYGK